jgi:hypothetical protein
VYGQPTYGAAKQITCRWDEARKQIFAADGSPIFTSIEIITQVQLAPKDLVRRGKLTSVPTPSTPKSNTGVYEVVMVSRTPTIRNNAFLYEAYA